MLLECERPSGRGGRKAADEAARTIAAVLHGTMRNSDILARYGDQQFAIVMPNTPIEGALTSAERAREALVGGVLRGNRSEGSVTVSIGVAQPLTDEPSHELLDRVAGALRKARNTGKNRTCFHDGQTSREAQPNSLADFDTETTESDTQQLAALPNR
jgi:diguanylate cyclase (GGDEF)-like protein